MIIITIVRHRAVLSPMNRQFWGCKHSSFNRDGLGELREIKELQQFFFRRLIKIFLLGDCLPNESKMGTMGAVIPQSFVMERAQAPSLSGQWVLLLFGEVLSRGKWPGQTGTGDAIFHQAFSSRKAEFWRHYNDPRRLFPRNQHNSPRFEARREPQQPPGPGRVPPPAAALLGSPRPAGPPAPPRQPRARPATPPAREGGICFN